MRRRLALSFVAALVLATMLVACGSNDDTDTAAPTGAPAEPTAGNWKTWVLASPSAVSVPPPPAAGSAEARAEVAEVKRLAEDRPTEVEAVVERWNGPLPTQPWTEMAFDFVSKSEKNPPLSSRNYALLEAAMYDAVLSAWHWKYEYDVPPPEGVDTMVAPGPDPSYPSEHAAIAGAASRVLAHLYPKQSALRLDEQAEEAAQSRVQAGTNTPADVAAGLELGRAVADQVIAKAKADGAETLTWNGTRPPGIGGGPNYWEPPPGSVSPPTEPRAGEWKAWVMPSNSQFRPPPPPPADSPEVRAAAQEIVDIKKNLTPEQARLADFWAGAEGSSLPAGIVVGEAQKDVIQAMTTGDPATRMTLPRAARALALLNIALDDAGIAAWDGKFTYWYPRPENLIRDLGIDPQWTPRVPTPRFPAYPSGSAGYGGAAESVLSYVFPAKAEEFKRRAEDQAISRIYAGIHWRFDAISLDAGRQIGNLVVERAKADGADS